MTDPNITIPVPDEVLTPEQTAELKKKAAEYDALSPQYKKLQGQLEKARRSGKDSRGTAALQAEFNKVHVTLAALLDVLQSSEGFTPEAKAKAASVVATASAQADATKVATAWLQEVESALEENDLDWEDPRLAKARSLWAANNWMGAKDEVWRVGKQAPLGETKTEQTPPETDVTKLIDKAVADALKRSGVRVVDTKDTSVPGRRGTVTPGDFARLNPQGKSTRELLKANEDLLDGFYKKGG